MSDSATATSGSCADGSTYNGALGLRIASIFVILVTSALGTLLPIVSRRFRTLRMSEPLFDFVRYFGTGVILSTAFIHLLSPAWEALSNDCLTGAWQGYPWPAALAMTAVFALWVIELAAHRASHVYLRKKGIAQAQQQQHGLAEEHCHRHPHVVSTSNRGKAVTFSATGDDVLEAGQGSECDTVADGALATKGDTEAQVGGASKQEDINPMEGALAQIVGVAILEFGIIFHSVIVGLTLAVNDDFVPIFIVLVFHQTFEGLGVGARLALLPLAEEWRWVPYVGALLYSAVTPIGIAIGLGVRETYNPGSATSLIVTGVFDSVSAGLLLWSSLVELLAHEFIFDRRMCCEASHARVAYNVCCVAVGAILMALLGKWA